MTTHKELIEKAEANGITVLTHIVTQQWGSRFQELAARNDDGIDGLIQIRQGGMTTGEIIHCQVKSGAGYLSSQNSDELRIGVKQDYIKQHRTRWNALVEPCILVYVEDSQDNILGRAWWVDLKRQDTYPHGTTSIIRIPKSQRLHRFSKGELVKLYGTWHLDHRLPEIIALRTDVNYIGFNRALKSDARTYFKWWRSLPVSMRTNPQLGEVTVSRVGWMHLTRRGRKRERIQQSFQLLGVARRIVAEVVEWSPLKRQSSSKEGASTITTHGTIALRAFVIFPHRYESVVTVILRRKTVHDKAHGKLIEAKTWLYSVFESRRGRLNPSK